MDANDLRLAGPVAELLIPVAGRKQVLRQVASGVHISTVAATLGLPCSEFTRSLGPCCGGAERLDDALIAGLTRRCGTALRPVTAWALPVPVRREWRSTQERPAA